MDLQRLFKRGRHNNTSSSLKVNAVGKKLQKGHLTPTAPNTSDVLAQNVLPLGLCTGRSNASLRGSYFLSGKQPPAVQCHLSADH